MTRKVVALAGGSGSAKLLRGLSKLPIDLTVVANVGDNFWIHGLYVCPDLDISMYTLAGVADKKKGWGYVGDTFRTLNQLKRLGEEDWFKLGDKDLATHLVRTYLLGKRMTLTEVTGKLCVAFGVPVPLLPVTDDSVETFLDTNRGMLHLQEFWVREKAIPKVKQVSYRGSEKASVAPQVAKAIEEAERVVVCPANPVTSIGPMLAVKGLLKALKHSQAQISALSPMLGDAPFSGPAGKLMKSTGLRPDSLGVAEQYSDFLDAILIDNSDSSMSKEIEQLGMRCRVSSTRLAGPRDEDRLAQELLEA